MGWRGILYVLFFLLTVVESSSRSFKIWLPTVGAESDSVVAYSWPVFTASLFVLVALILSTYLIIEHLAAYNQPEVHAHNPFVVVQVFVSYCIFLYALHLVIPFWCSHISSIEKMRQPHLLQFHRQRFLQNWSLQFGCLISGTEVLDWTHFDGSRLCTWIGIKKWNSVTTYRLCASITKYQWTNSEVWLILWAVFVTVKFRCRIQLWSDSGLLWSICIVLLWEIFDCLLRYYRTYSILLAFSHVRLVEKCLLS